MNHSEKQWKQKQGGEKYEDQMSAKLQYTDNLIFITLYYVLGLIWTFYQGITKKSGLESFICFFLVCRVSVRSTYYQSVTEWILKTLFKFLSLWYLTYKTYTQP